MTRKDVYHETVRHALIQDGWTITDDPLILPYGDQELYADLGAERMLGAEKGEHKIAVEVKSFIGKSDVVELERAIGQHLLYLNILAELEPDRELYLAVSRGALERVFMGRLGRLVLSRTHMKLLVFDAALEVIVQWIR
jgi:hypothetical protein